MLKIQSTRKNEKGIALVFTLVMLSLLMILALSFALDSMFSQKAAYNSASSSSSGFMGQAQLNQVLLLMKNDQANFDSGRLYSKDISYDPASPSTSVEDKDMLVERLQVPGVLAADDGVLDPDANPSTDDPKVNWSYTKDADGKIIGRTAFVVIPDDKTPLDSLLDDSVSPSTTQNEKNDSERRIGKDVCEINVRGAIPAVTSNISTITEKLNWKTGYPEAGAGFTNGLYTGSWSSFSSLFTALGITDANEKKKFEDKLSLDTFKDKEAFWVDADGDSKTVDSELYNRFDLTRGDWSTSTTNAADKTYIQNVILLDSDGDGVPDVDMGSWDGNDSLEDFSTPADLTKYSKGLPWLACFGYKDNGSGVGIPDETLKGTFASVKDRRYQIAANLKDYCDYEDDGSGNPKPRPTSDVSPVLSDSPNWTTTATAPKYTGNERTPYIDKLGVKLSVKQYSREVSTGVYGISLAADISVAVGLVNIYETGWSENLKIKVEGTINFKTTIATGSGEKTTPIPFSHTLDCFTSEWSGNYSKFIINAADSYPNGSQYIGEETGFTSANKKIDINEVEITFTKVVLYKDGGNGYDYLNSITQTNTNVIALNSGEAVKDYWYGFAVDDPRQNLNNGDWKALTSASGSDPNVILHLTGSGSDFYGLSNSTPATDPDPSPQPTELPSTGPDAEPGSEIALSTAHIRNGAMKSPWELGLIHRGAKWETINLKTYDKTKAVKLVKIPDASGKNYIPGGGAYASGDANILDQIKMTKKAEVRQKINLKASDVTTLNALLYKVCVKGSVGDMSIDAMSYDASNYLDANHVNTTIANITKGISGDGTGGGIFYKYTTNPVALDILTRASVVDKLLLPGTTGITADNDAAQEELIGKIVNLTKVSSGVESFTVIVLAQTIKDIDSGGASITKYASDGTTSASQVCAFGTFDMKDNGSSKTNVYFDEIAGEQKIMAKCRVINGKINIVKFQYCD